MKLGSPKRLRQLAADALKEFRKRKKEGDSAGACIAYGLYIAYKCAAWRVKDDLEMEEHRGS